MSREQATAERHLDRRSDIYSLGCVVYEMLGGNPPFMASSATRRRQRTVAMAIGAGVVVAAGGWAAVISSGASKRDARKVIKHFRTTRHPTQSIFA